MIETNDFKRYIVPRKVVTELFDDTVNINDKVVTSVS